MTIYDFAEAHGLELEFHERKNRSKRDLGFSRYFAKLKGCEIKERSLLRSGAGNGNTHTEAAKRLAGVISNQTLVIDAYKNTRREIAVPNLAIISDREEIRDTIFKMIKDLRDRWPNIKDETLSGENIAQREILLDLIDRI